MRVMRDCEPLADFTCCSWCGAVGHSSICSWAPKAVQMRSARLQLAKELWHTQHQAQEG
jgi:hypothetical protein